VNVVVEDRDRGWVDHHEYPSNFMVGSQNIGCNMAVPSLIAPFDSSGSSASREFLFACVINNTDTAQGGPVAMIAKVNVSSVNWKNSATAFISYRVLYNAAPESFVLDPHWSISSGTSSLSTVLRNLRYRSEVIAAYARSHMTIGFLRPNVVLLFCHCDVTSSRNWTRQLLFAMPIPLQKGRNQL